jgi:hypothetical protein
MKTSECLLTSIELGFGDDAVGRSAETARSRGLLSSAEARAKDGDSDLADCTRCGWELVPVVSSLGAFGAVPKDRSRSSFGNSRFAGIEGRFVIRPGRTHCMLLGPPLIGALGAENGRRSGGGYIGGGRGAMGVRSAFGPVGIFAGKLLGDVLTGAAPVLRGPRAAAFAIGDASRGAYGGNGVRENWGEALGRNAACGAIGGGRDFGAGP